MKSRAAVGATAISIILAACASATTASLPAGESAAPGRHAERVELTIERWRNDDLAVWEDAIIPAFEEANPGITVTFAPTAPTEYNAALNSKLEGGSAGDLITCRPFDAAPELF